MISSLKEISQLQNSNNSSKVFPGFVENFNDDNFSPGDCEPVDVDLNMLAINQLWDEVQ